ncbi:MAG: hypothetical protein ABSF03_22660 [Streptosporangiaceae bacterium]
MPSTAPAGETIKFSATVSVGSLTATATAPTVTVAKVSSSSSPTPSKKSAGGGSSSSSTPGVSGAGLSGASNNLGSALPVGTLPLVPGATSIVPTGSASGLFPQISPSSVPSPAPGSQASPGKNPVATSSVIPLSLTSSEFGAQIIGLIVLLLGVAIAVTRLSVRKARATGKPSR